MARIVRGLKFSSEFRKDSRSSNINLNKVLYDLEKISNTLFKWFTDNLLKANPEKSHLLNNSTQEI